MINAGTVTAWLTLDTNRFNAGIESANAQLKSWKDENLTAAQKIQGVGGALTTIGGTLTRSVTLPLVGAGAAAVKVAADFDSGMSKVQAISGATGEDLDKLREKAREMGSKTKFSASEAADAMSYMAMAGWKTGDMLDGIEGIMNLAAASGEDLATTSDIVTDALTAFGLKAKDSAHFSDILAAASSNANTNVSMMGESFKYCAPIAGAMGYSAEDVAEALGLMANSGIKASQAGTSLRFIMAKLNGDIRISGKELGDVTIKTTNADGSMRELSDILADLRGAFSKLTESEKSQAAEALAGKYAMSGFLSLMNAAPEDVEKLSGAISTCDGASKRMAETMQNNLRGQLTVLKSQTEELAISVGEELVPAARGLVEKAGELVSWFSSLDSGTRRMIVNAGMVAAAAGPVATVLGTVTSGVGTLITTVGGAAAAFTTAGGGIAGVGAALTSIITPAGWVVLGLTAVTAAGVALYAAHRNATKGTRELGDAMKGAAKYAEDFSSGIETAGSGTSDFADVLSAGFDLNDVKEKISKVQQKITAITSKAHSERRELTQKEIKKLKEYFVELRKLTNQEFEYYQGRLGAIESIADSGMEMTKENAQKILSAAGAAKKEASELAWQSYQDEISYINATTKEGSAERRKQTDDAKANYDKRLADIDAHYAAVTSKVTNAYAQQNLADSDFFNKLKEHNDNVEAENQRHNEKVAELEKRELQAHGSTLMESLIERKKHSDEMNRLNGELADSFDTSAQEIVGTLAAMLADMQGTDGQMTDETREFVEAFLACYDSLPDDMKEVMGDTVEGMRRALESGKPEIEKTARAMVQVVPDISKETLDEHSPSKVMEKIGGFAVDGLILGMNEKKGAAVSAVSGIMSNMLTAANAVNFSPVGSNIVSGILQGMNGRKSALLTAAGSLADSVSGRIKAALRIQSPSRVMMEIGEYTAEGMELGLKQGSRGLYATASAISLETADLLSGIAPAWNPGLSGTLSGDRLDRLDRILDAVERLADSQTTMEIDGRPFGRLVREFV